ncbi:MAG: hypothetical protein ACETWG_00595 [Candidatus Neomarinimicrobiota bacterium]
MMRHILTASLLTAILLTLPACEESTEPEPWSGEVLLHEVDGCQAQWLGKSALIDSFSYQFETDLVLDFFVESNCCPDTNRFDLFSNITEDTIAITVVDTAQHLCDCICPYLIHAEVTDLPRDEYIVKVVYYGEVIYLEAVQRDLSSDQPQTDVNLAFYLLLSDTLNAYDALEQSLGDLMLQDKPILSIDGITSYQWPDHSFTVTSSAYNRMEDILGEYASHIDLRGAPFVIVVEAERVYLGAFWNPISSIPPPCPSITFPPLTEAPRTLLIAEPWRDAYPDQRSDPRIYKALKAAGVLRDDYATLQNLEVRFLNVYIWLDLMPTVPMDTSRFNCRIDLELFNTSTDKHFSGLSIPTCTVELDSTGEFVGLIAITSEWDGQLAAGERDTIRLTNADVYQPLSIPACNADVTVRLRVNYRWEASQAYTSDPVEFECTY